MIERTKRSKQLIDNCESGASELFSSIEEL